MILETAPTMAVLLIALVVVALILMAPEPKP